MARCSGSRTGRCAGRQQLRHGATDGQRRIDAWRHEQLGAADVCSLSANPYNVLKGTFSGLFYETDFVHDTSGFFSFVMSANGSFSGSIIKGSTYSMSGQFDSAGSATVSVTRPGTTALTVTMAVDLGTNFTETVTGTVTDGNWTSALAGDRTPFNASTYPAPQAGRYTIAFPGAAGSTTIPAGDGYGTLTVDAAGKVKFAGVLADGTAISQSTSISKNGEWPFYVPLYKGQGSIISWITFTNSGTSGLSGAFSWNKNTVSNSTFYPSGFGHDSTATGSTFTAPSSGTSVLGVSNGNATFDDGSLSSAFASGFTLSSAGILAVDAPATNGLTLSLSASSGLTTGGFTHPNTGKKSVIKGVILRITKLFAIRYPIIQAGMVWCSGAKLAAAAANAGALGLIGAGSMKPELLIEHIRKCRQRTNAPFGVNIPLIRGDVAKLIDATLSEGVRIVFTSAGNPALHIDKFKAAGVTVVHVVASVKHALKAQSVGVDAVVAEGFEAGGPNGLDEITTFCLIPQVADAVTIPVIAAGGIADGRGMAPPWHWVPMACCCGDGRQCNGQVHPSRLGFFDGFDRISECCDERLRRGQCQLRQLKFRHQYPVFIHYDQTIALFHGRSFEMMTG